MKYLLALLFIPFSIFYFNSQLDQVVMLTAIAIVGLVYFSDTNIRHICILLFVTHLLGFSFFHFELFALSDESIQVWKNNRIYLIHFLTDVVMFLLIATRPILSRNWLTRKGKETKEVLMTNADMALMTVFLLFICIDLLAMAENLIRNLEYLGVNEEFAKQFWGWDWVFYNYSSIKSILLGLELAAVLSITTKMARQNFTRRKAAA
ncbi:hypothetical protein [Pseudoalteromonas peptidolytica]|uniref:Uncharacterized protein n=1 Tax=Pseudoalteromonas peptidolytica F12-50-A1 TaxID=1315280 RepID=A0A8I0MYE3_9GAMM|nr:hypothetical protein [Pseudoalteromonas peptidolytica]MBE0347531.1 hypothetical protein [Pseudoalteromonas peptidolytica F12-50-A1]NLR13284.1 hypothetical protein [Pseudoalteromonas peptidolytica]GEK11772.1 hypothetical protein PPE03_40210 [Pseudoalteromonas peptidolytica]